MTLMARVVATCSSNPSGTEERGMDSNPPSVDIEAIKAQMREGNFVVSAHADQAVADEGLDIAEIRDAILDGEILENYENTGRGPSCLNLGFVKDTPIHVVCGWRRQSVVIITAYVPIPPKFENPWTRRRSS
jgi:hypothetical protein